MKLNNIIWTSVASAVLAVSGLIATLNNSDLGLTLVLSSITFAILSLRE